MNVRPVTLCQCHYCFSTWSAWSRSAEAGGVEASGGGHGILELVHCLRCLFARRTAVEWPETPLCMGLHKFFGSEIAIRANLLSARLCNSLFTLYSLSHSYPLP